MDPSTQPEFESSDHPASRLIQEHWRMLVAYVAARIHQRDRVEDVCQDVMLEIVRAWNTYRSNTTVRALGPVHCKPSMHGRLAPAET